MKVKRGHMVSSGYLAGWADSGNRVEVFDVQAHRGFTSSITNATVVTYVYDPRVLTHDLEGAYGRIENAGIPVIAKLRSGADSLTGQERDAVIAFLDMRLERGRYADRSKVRVPAVLIKTDNTTEESELALGDMLTLLQSHPDTFRLNSLPLVDWDWKVIECTGLTTGDGAVLQWRRTDDEPTCTVTFPLSPTRLLVIGADLHDGIPLNALIAKNSKRWVVGAVGSMNLKWINERSSG